MRSLILALMLLTPMGCAREEAKRVKSQDEVMGQDEVVEMMRAAVRAGQAGTARKTKPVDARPAKPGEVVVSVIAGEGEETRSKPAEAGDWVVRNRCPETGNEQYLVKADRFADRYSESPGEADAEGWRGFTPRAEPVRYFVVAESSGDFSFMAPWGEPMAARPGDAIVQDPKNETDIYRVAAGSFACTYEVLEAAK